MYHYTKEHSLLELTNDAVFKLYFTKEENRAQLKQFLKATTHLTDDDLTTLEINNPVLTKEHVLDKDFIVDINLTSKTGHKIIVEMQVVGHENFIERVVAYSGRRYSSQLKRGGVYTDLKECITLIITNFEMFEDTKEYYEHILFRRINGKPFTNAQQFYIIDLTKMPKEGQSTIEKWGGLFTAETKEELKMLMETSKEMKETGERLLELSADEKARELAEAREFSQWAFDTELHARENKGRKEELELGLEQGAYQNSIEVVKKLIKRKLSNNDIVEDTNLPIEVIEQLQKELKM